MVRLWLDRWLGGHSADIADPTQFAVQLADFLVSLRSVNAAEGPQPVHGWYRGATLLPDDATARWALDTLTAHSDVDFASEVWTPPSPPLGKMSMSGSTAIWRRATCC